MQYLSILVPHSIAQLDVEDPPLQPNTSISARSFQAIHDVDFIIYDSHDTTRTAHRIPLNDHTKLLASPFDAARETRYLIHGWNGDFSSKINTDLRAAYALHPQRLNIVVVDWSRGAGTILYMLAKWRVVPVGQAIAAFVDFVYIASGQRPDRIGLVGYSLGAHVAGVAGKNVRSGRVASIVALDAASPLFWYDRVDERLDGGDADYVEVIHTNLGPEGYKLPLGHADFYPNWGQKQPGCGWDWFRTCSHRRSIELFADSVAVSAIAGRRPLVGVRCARGWQEVVVQQSCTANGTATMGGEPVRGEGGRKSGVFYVKTNGKKPFA